MGHTLKSVFGTSGGDVSHSEPLRLLVPQSVCHEAAAQKGAVPGAIHAEDLLQAAASASILVETDREKKAPKILSNSVTSKHIPGGPGGTWALLCSLDPQSQ